MSNSGLPEAWAQATLAELFDVNPGKPPADALPAMTPVSFVPMSAVDAASGAITQPEERPFGKVRNGYTAFAEGDVILAKITPCFENGKVAIARGLRNGLGFGSSEFHVFRPRGGAVLAEYLFHFLRQQRLREEAADHMTGTAGQARVPAEYVKHIELPVPPLAEQHSIVAKVEALLARVNVARDRLAKVPAILKRFRQSVLAAACSGRLTEDWRAQHLEAGKDAESLLSHLRVSRCRKWELSQAVKCERRGTAIPTDLAARYREPPPPEQTDLVDAPVEWRWTTLAALSEIVGGITKGQKRRPGEKLRSVPYLRVANVQRGFLDLSEIKYIDATDDEIAALRLLPDDILFTEGGDRDKLGRGWIWGGEIEECIHQNHIFRARLYSNMVQGRFVSWYANSAGQSYFIDEGRQTVNLASINLTKLASLPIPLPSAEEQVEIVRRLDTLFKLADAIERRVANATDRAGKLTQAILGKAFRGELVPTEAELARREGRTYEPASALLSRIRAALRSDIICPRPRRLRSSECWTRR